jgi:hypothetical protein
MLMGAERVPADTQRFGNRHRVTQGIGVLTLWVEVSQLITLTTYP